MIDFNFQPQPETIAKTVALNLAFRFAMQAGKPLEVKKFDGEFVAMSDLENRPWLTSLRMSTHHEGKRYSLLFPEVIISITQQRNIVTTSLQGRDGTIKEYISNGDYGITLDIALTDYEGEPDEQTDEEFLLPKQDYPISRVETLRKLLTTPQTVEVESDFLYAFGIRSAVVTSFSLQQETHSNRQSVQIQMLSDEPYEIKQIQQDEYVKISK
nr:DUF6046 domain-containing protein [uncultured Capnocytophaga sp.]